MLYQFTSEDAGVTRSDENSRIFVQSPGERPRENARFLLPRLVETSPMGETDPDYECVCV